MANQRIAAIKIADILIPEDRVREEFGDLTEITESMKGFAGQISSIAVVETPEAEQPYRLVAGERRIRARIAAGLDDVFAIIYTGELLPEQEKTIELIENTQRLGMTWQEEVKAKQKIHELQVAIHGEKYAPTDKEGWAQSNTAKMLKVSEGSLSEDLALAKAAEVIDLSQFKDKRSAKNAVARAQEKLLTEELARRHAERINAGTENPVFEILTKGFVIGNFFQKIKEYPDNFFDFIDLDPPYGIDFADGGSFNASGIGDVSADKREGFVEVAASDYPAFIEQVFSECYRVMKPNAWMICWFAQEPWSEVTYQAMLRSGVEARRIPGVWCKVNPDENTSRQVANPEVSLSHFYEPFFYGRKGKAFINKRARGDIFHYKVPQDKIHPTEKPVALYEDLYSTFCTPASKILIPFLGSGNGLIAAHRQKMTAIGFELAEDFRNAFIHRLPRMVAL